jgi:hypothetical protein
MTKSSYNNFSGIINSSCIEENFNERFSYIFNLATPRIIRIKKGKNEEYKKYVIALIPSEICQSHLIEHYILQWIDITNSKDVIR